MPDLAPLIDHTLLKPEAAPDDVRRLCDEAMEHGFASACVNGRFIELVARRLEGSGVRACGVVSFPLGAMRPTAAAVEATLACKDGADEIDFVAHLPHLLAADADAATAEFSEIVKAARAVRSDVVVKVIFETAALAVGVDGEELERRIAAGCLAARRSGCDFVKTSTGFHAAGGATVEAVRLMAEGVREAKLGVKASGGIRTREDAVRMVEAGATRLGCSAGVAIVSGGAGDAGY